MSNCSPDPAPRLPRYFLLKILISYFLTALWLFASDAAAEEFSKLKFTNESLGKFRAKIEARGGESIYRSWASQIGTNGNFVYRGMTLTSDELNLVLKEGMQLAKTGSEYGGIYAATEPFTPLTYALFGPGMEPKEKNLAVLFEIRSSSLKMIHENHPYENFVKIQGSIPVSSINRVLIFDPNGNVSKFPFYELDLEQ